MGRFVLVVMGLLAWIAVANSGYALPAALDDKLWLVGLFPAVYILGLMLIGD
ncbi:MAG: hypothetical protein AB7F78_23965 [Hyphomicrobiaceae bacterium]